MFTADGSMILYSGNVWGQAHPDDLSRCKDDEDFHEKGIALLTNAGRPRAAATTGRLSETGAVTAPDQLSRPSASRACLRTSWLPVLIKAQHNTVSDSRSYSR